jgi:hypothetical protein
VIFKFRHEGKLYEFNDERMSLPEARWVQRETGMSGPQLFDGFRKAEVDALLAIFCLALKRGGMEIESIADAPLDPDNGYYELLTSVQAGNSDQGAPRSVRRKTAAKG